MRTRDEIEDLANVIGTGYGPDGELVVWVTKKIPEDELADEDIVDKVVDVDGDEKATDVEEVHIPHFEGGHQTRHRPSPGGVSIGTDDGGAGTMGACKLDWEPVDFPVTLTNRHVSEDGETVYQPALLDGGSRSDVIGEVVESSEFTSGDNTTDSALIRVNPADVNGEIFEVGELAGFREATFVKHTKSGRTTGVTRGRLRGRDARMRVTYGPETHQFVGINVFDDMSAPGDSGSLIGVLEDGKFYATSLLFAGSDRVTLGIPIQAVMDYHGEFTVWSDEPDEPDEPDEGNDDWPEWYQLLMDLLTILRRLNGQMETTRRKQ